jgi:hypothetical protein
MLTTNKLLTSELQQIADIRAQLEMQENLYTVSLKADQEFQTLKEIWLKIKNLKNLLREAEANQVTVVYRRLND